MKAFKDISERSWQIRLTIGAVKDLRDCLEVDLLALNAGEEPLLNRLATDPVLLVDVLYVLCGDQHEDITDEAFGKSLDGQTFLHAQTAFFEELADFFQSQGRTDIVAAIIKQQEIVSEAVKVAQEQIAGLDTAELMNQPGQPSTS